LDGHALAIALRGAYLAMHRRTSAALAAEGATAEQFVVLHALSQGEAITQQELVERTSSDPNTLRAILVLLERQQLISRRKHPTDGRAKTVTITRQGRSALKRLWQHTEAIREEIALEFSLTERRQLAALLGKVTAATTGDSKVVDSTN
jgi:DNA-binding MarR family transcriptional regulator